MGPLPQFLSSFSDTISQLYDRSDGARWNLDRARFAQALYQAAARKFAENGASANPDTVAAFLESLHVQDLALALACSEGNEASWREFDLKFRPAIEGFARAITRDDQRARELADCLYADLFGLTNDGGRRRSPLEHYHGRSPLGGWLRVVIARRDADAWRMNHRMLSSIDLDSALAVDANHTIAEPDDPERTRYVALLAGALQKTLCTLAARDRLRLSYYYVQELTLAETGTLLGEHESTVSRNLTRTRDEIKLEVSRVLKREYRLSDDQIGLCFEYAIGDWPFDLARVLAQAK